VDRSYLHRSGARLHAITLGSAERGYIDRTQAVVRLEEIGAIAFHVPRREVIDAPGAIQRHEMEGKRQRRVGYRRSMTTSAAFGPVIVPTRLSISCRRRPSGQACILAESRNHA
jgi:hypothetical protein